MLIYEKNNKLNINFDPSKSIEGTPDIQIGENEIKLGDAEITSENVLPTPTNEDVGKIVSVGEGGSYELVPFQEPTGTIEITENGIVDVADYANANVNVPSVTWRGKIQITNNKTSGNVNILYLDATSRLRQTKTVAKGETVEISAPTHINTDEDECVYDLLCITASNINITSNVSAVYANSGNITLVQVSGRYPSYLNATLTITDATT